MAIHPPRCIKCGRTERNDLDVISARYDTDGELQVRIQCFCGHQWERKAEHCERLPGYKKAVANATKAQFKKSIKYL